MDLLNPSLSQHGKSAQVLCLMIMVLQTISQAEFIGIQFSNQKFRSYFFLSWFAYCWLMIVFPLFFIGQFLGSRFLGKDISLLSHLNCTIHRLRENEGFSFRRIVKLAFFFSLCNITSMFVWLLTLSLVPAGIAIAVYQSCLVFVFVFSVIFLKEQIVVLKVAAVFSCLLGVLTLLTNQSPLPPPHHQDKQTPNQMNSYYIFLPLICALIDSIYQILYSKTVGLYNGHAALFVISVCGFVGTFYGLIVPLLYLTNLEPPPLLTPSNLKFIFSVVFFNMWYYVMLVICLILMSPLVFNVGYLLSFPGASLIDVLFRGVVLGLWDVAGLLLIFLGVLLMILNDYRSPEKKFN